MLNRINLFLSSLNQSLKQRNLAKDLNAFLKTEIEYIHSLPQQSEAKKGTLIIKCDDIGDFFIWQHVIPHIEEHAERPITFVCNKVLQPIIEAWYDFADAYIYIDKSKWNSIDYRHDMYAELRSVNPALAFTTLFTRNFKQDDLLLLASDASRRIAWDRSHHAYFSNLDITDQILTNSIKSSVPILLEYHRNLELIEKIYKVKIDHTFKPKFPSFNKQNRLIIAPIASAKSKTWQHSNFAKLILEVLPDYESIILLGGPNAVESCLLIQNAVNNPKLINLAGQTQLTESVPLIGESKHLLSADTFALHIAAQTCTDTVVLSNGTNWQRFIDYSDTIKSKMRPVYPPHFTPDKDKVKLRYSSSEINGIQVKTVVEALRNI
ncbi:MAG: glycosyltransferase family 9 protein [Bacteroidia bacterium]